LIEVLDGNGEPSPSGIRLAARIVSGDSLKFASNTASRTNTNLIGEATLRMKTTEEKGETILRVEFEDERYGPSVDRALRVRDPGDPAVTQLVVTIQRDGEIVAGDDVTILADGEQTLEIEAVLLPSPTAQFALAGREITLKILEGPGFLDSEGTTEIFSVTGDTGTVETVFHGGALAGTAVLEVMMVDPDPDGDGATLVEQIPINVKALGFIDYLGINPEVLFVRGSTENESGVMSFRVLDTDQEPIVGVVVRFDLENPPTGVTLSPSLSTSDEEGVVSTVVQSGTGVGAFSVTAIAELGEAVIQAPSPAIPVVGAKPTRRGFTLTCDTKNLAGFRDRVGDDIIVDVSVSCTSRLVDRFQNGVGIAASITFLSEGGGVIGPATSAAWDFVGNPESPPEDMGTFGAPYSPRGRPPCDTDPLTDEDDAIVEPYLFIDRQDGNCSVQLSNCPAVADGSCSLNPRDGLVTIVAVTAGEEEFSDLNADGTYNDGEAFWDLGEPFVDTNDNNRHDLGEFFLDLGEPGNGIYDGPNGRWDSQTNIWTATHLLLTGQSRPRAEVQEGEPYEFTTYLFQSEPTFFLIEDAEHFAPDLDFTVGINWMDGFLNRPNASCSYDVGLFGEAEGWSLDNLDVNDITDSLGFDVEFRSTQIEVGRNTYVTRVIFPTDRNGPQPLGVRHLVRIVLDEEEYAPNATLRFSHTCQIAPGAGGSRTTNVDLRVVAP
jgi:hypothetical protein